MYIKSSLLQLTLLGFLTIWIPQNVSGAWWDAIQSGVSSCGQPGYFVNPVNCAKFFRCVDHSTSERHLLVRYDFDCPTGTVFDQGTSVCVNPRGAGCAGWSSSGPASPGGWSPTPGGWSPPAPGGWSPPKGGWGWVPPKAYYEGWTRPGHSYWSFTPGSSFVVIYDRYGRKRSVDSVDVAAAADSSEYYDDQ